MGIECPYKFCPTESKLAACCRHHGFEQPDTDGPAPTALETDRTRSSVATTDAQICGVTGRWPAEPRARSTRCCVVRPATDSTRSTHWSHRRPHGMSRHDSNVAGIPSVSSALVNRAHASGASRGRHAIRHNSRAPIPMSIRDARTRGCGPSPIRRIVRVRGRASGSDRGASRKAPRRKRCRRRREY